MKVTYVPSFPQLPTLPLRCNRICEVINPTAHKDFPQICVPLFRLVVLSLQPKSCTKLSLLSKQQNKNTQERKI